MMMKIGQYDVHPRFTGFIATVSTAIARSSSSPITIAISSRKLLDICNAHHLSLVSVLEYPLQRPMASAIESLTAHLLEPPWFWGHQGESTGEPVVSLEAPVVIGVCMFVCVCVCGG